MSERDVRCGKFGSMTLGDPTTDQSLIYVCGKYEGWYENPSDTSGGASLISGRKTKTLMFLATMVALSAIFQVL